MGPKLTLQQDNDPEQEISTAYTRIGSHESDGMTPTEG